MPVLLVAAAAFCLLSDKRALVYLAASIIGNFTWIHLLRRYGDRQRERRILTAFGIALNVAPLIAFRWQEAAHQASPAAAGSAVALVPLGLAFYTLQQVSFLIDAQRPDARLPGFARYAAWASLFCQLPAGPVATWRMMEEQYARLGRVVPSPAMVMRGVGLFLAGLVKKTWIADPLAGMVDALWHTAQSATVSPVEAWLITWGFLLQLYFDFSSYSDIAIGLALCFGIVLPVNFNSPLKARSPGEYVMRWHVSLMMFVRGYVFEPAFRAARRLPIRPTPRRYATAWALATVAAFVTVGGWHSLAPATLAAALGIGPLIVLLQISRMGPRDRGRAMGRARRRFNAVTGQVMVLLAASIFALFLRASDVRTPFRLFRTMLDVRAATRQVDDVAGYASAWMTGVPIPLPDLLPVSGFPATIALQLSVATTVIALACPNTMALFGMVDPTGSPADRLRWRPSAVWGAATGVLLMLALAGITGPVPQHGFIYARF